MPLPDDPSIVIVTPDEELEVTVGALRAHGATATDALTQATMLVEGDLRGHPSHGIRRLPPVVPMVGRPRCPVIAPVPCARAA